jgi:beta-lactamase superfamily II metal-dependent hydrolase
MTCEISFLPVGNADCIVVSSDNAVIVVDLGKKERVIYKWLKNRNLDHINRIYITHRHRDHFPFSSLINLVKFLDLWFSNDGAIEIFSLPYGIYENAYNSLDAKREADADYQALKDALDQLDDWDRSDKIRFVEALCDPTPYSINNLKIFTLHPRSIFVAQQKHKKKVNELSLVLRVVYGKFSAILMADLENEGLSDYLSVVKSSNSAREENKATIVKIPHHGAWPVNGNELEILLEFMEAELAILSVGSQNNYGHVRPELFKALITLQNKAIQNKKQFSFICTEVTRTCKYSASDRSAMKNKGLSSTEKCAGEITIIAEESGKWKLKTETKHSDVVRGFNYAACTERADLI